jgi:hypothetical protein
MASFYDHLNAADSMFDFARRLGDACLTREADLETMRGKSRPRTLLAALESRISGTKPSDWISALSDDPAALSEHVGGEIAGLLGEADTLYPLDCLGVLRGFLRGPLIQLFDAFEGRVILDVGTPVPFATRPVNKVIKPKPTPYQPTLGASELLDKCGARLFDYGATSQVQVCLDFAQRDQVDQLTWNDESGLPKIALLHPPRCGELKGAAIGDGQFFDAGPRHWELDQILALLERAAAEAGIAVLPELSLERPEALSAALKQAPGRYPELIIAGSGHARLSVGGEEIRANEGRIYLRGEEIGAYRKNKPYKTERLNGEDLAEPLLEGLTSEPKVITVLSGSKTRLAVAICADINHLKNPEKLLAACVNLLFVPSFTPEPGAFNGPVADLAARCQGVSVILNAPPDDAATPFHLIAGVPRQNPGEQTAMYSPPGETPTHLGLFDPNLPLDRALEWR